MPQNKTIALAFDPHAHGFAYAVVEELPRTRPPHPHEVGRLRQGAYVRVQTGEYKGELRDGRRTIRALCDEFKPAIVAVETVGGYLSAERQARQRSSAWDLQDLVNASFWAGLIAGVLPNPDAAFLMPANNTPRSRQAWRLHLTGSMRAGDAHVAQALNAYLQGGLPLRGKRKDRTPIYQDNNHRRDALGLAVVALGVGHARTAP